MSLIRSSLLVAESLGSPSVFVDGPRLCSFVAWIACAQAALRRSPGHHISAGIKSSTAESAKWGTATGESPPLEGPDRNAQKLGEFTLRQEFLQTAMFAGG